MSKFVCSSDGINKQINIAALLTPCWVDGKEGVAKPNFHGAYEILDPSKDSTFFFLEKFIAEVVQVFPDQYLHLGMDESYPSCW